METGIHAMTTARADVKAGRMGRLVKQLKKGGLKMYYEIKVTQHKTLDENAVLCATSSEVFRQAKEEKEFDLSEFVIFLNTKAPTKRTHNKKIKDSELARAIIK